MDKKENEKQKIMMAIKLTCFKCSDEKYRDVADCFYKTCALYNVRPGTRDHELEELVRAVKTKCMDCHNWQEKEVRLCSSQLCRLVEFRGVIRREKFIPDNPNDAL